MFVMDEDSLRALKGVARLWAALEGGFSEEDGAGPAVGSTEGDLIGESEYLDTQPWAIRLQQEIQVKQNG